MKKNNVLPSLRIKSDLKEKIDKAIKTFGEKNSNIKLPLTTFRQMALEFYANELLSRKANLKV